MQYTYYCPTCRAQVAYGESCCRNCGVPLYWEKQQTPQQQQQYSSSYENQGQYPAQSWDQQAQNNQQQAWGGQSRWSQSNNAQGWRTGNQNSQSSGQADQDFTETRFTPAVITLLIVLALLITGVSVALAMNWTSITSSLRQQPSAAVNTPITQPVAPPNISSFTASRASVTAGQPVTLQWVTTGATDVTIDPGIGKVALSGVADVAPTSQTLYKLTAANSGGSVTASITVTMAQVAMPVIDYFSATPSNINGGDSTTLQWNVTGASSVSVDKGVGTVAASGKYMISPAASDNYTLTATNSAGKVTAKASVTVILGKAPVITSFTVTPSSIVSGQSAILAWVVTGATAVALDQGFGPVGGSGTLTVSPKTTTTYTISAAYGATPVKASVTITMPVTSGPVITAFTSNPAVITTGQSSNLQWNVVGAMSVSIDHGIGTVTASGTTPVSPTTHTTYTLTAASDNGTVTATSIVTVTQPTTPVISSFTSSPPTINAGQSATLQWTVTGSNSVSVDQGVGPVPQSGTSTVTPTATTTYILTAVGSSASPTATITVTVVRQGIPIITSFAAIPSTINTGDNATLQWDVTGANSVTIDRGIGVVPLSGTRGVGPATTTTYTLTAQGNSGPATSTATITVSAPD